MEIYIEHIKGKVVVTGASSGLGESAARHLADREPRVALGARRLDRLEAIAAEIRRKGGEAVVAKTDVTKRKEVRALTDPGLAAFGRIDVIVDIASLMAIIPLDAGKVDEWDAMIDINIKGVRYGIAAALSVFGRKNSGYFINLSSVGGTKVSAPGGVV